MHVWSKNMKLRSSFKIVHFISIFYLVDLLTRISVYIYTHIFQEINELSMILFIIWVLKTVRVFNGRAYQCIERGRLASHA